MSRRTMYRYAAVALLAIALSGLKAAAETWDQATGLSPIAWFSNAGSTYTLYGKNAAIDNLQVWEAAEAQCASTGGHLMSVAGDNDNVIATQMNQYLLDNGGKTFGTTKLCTWLGATKNVMAASLSFTDGAATAYLNTSLGNNTQAAADLYFADDTSCVAVCAGKYYFRDCDYEAQSFICKQADNTTQTSTLASAVKLSLTVAVSGAISVPVPAYPPTYPAPIFSGKNITVPLRNNQTLTNYYKMTFSKCLSNEGFHYCAATATQSSGQPRTWTEAQSFCNRAMYDGLAAPFTVATIGSDAELAYLLASFPTNSSVVGFWTAGVKSAYAKPVYVVPALQAANNTWLSARAVVSPTLSPDYATTWSWYELSATYRGNCLNGTGCGLAITYAGNGSGAPGLQLADLGFGMSVLCKAPLAKPTITAFNLSGLPAVTPAPLPPCTTLYYTAKLTTVAAVSSLRCSEMARELQNASFLPSISKSVADAWNARQPNSTITPGHVQVNSVTSICFLNDRGDSKLFVTSTISLPPTTPASVISGVSAASFAFADPAVAVSSIPAANTAQAICAADIIQRPDVSCPLLPLLASTRRENCEVYAAQTMSVTFTMPFADCAGQLNLAQLCEFKASAIRGTVDAWNNGTGGVTAKLAPGDVVITGVALSCLASGNSTMTLDVLVYLPSSVPVASISSASWKVLPATDDGRWTIKPTFSAPLQVTAPCINTRPAGTAFVSLHMFAALQMSKAGCANVLSIKPEDFGSGFAELAAAAWNTSAPATPITKRDVVILGINSSACLANATDGAVVVIDFSLNLPPALTSAAVTAVLPAFVKAAPSAMLTTDAVKFGVVNVTLTFEPPKIQIAPAAAVTARPPGAQFVKVHLYTTLQLSRDTCVAINGSQADFALQFAAATAAGWSNQTSTKLAGAGDVVVLSLRPDCGNGTYASTVVLAFDVNLPGSVTASAANETALAFQAAYRAVYLTSAFGMSFQVLGANVTFDAPKLVKQPFAPVSAKAPGAAYISAKLYAVVNVSNAACTQVAAGSDGFAALFSVAAATGLTVNANLTKEVKDGDVNVTGVSTQCSGADSSAAVQWSLVYVNLTIAMPKGSTTEQAAAALQALKAAGTGAFNFGSLVNTFAVTSVTLTFDAPQQVVVPPPPKTPRKEGDELVAVPLKASMKLSSKACQEAAADLAAFTFMYQTTTAGAWNNQYYNKTTGAVIPALAKYLIQVGDVIVRKVLTNCGTSRRSTLRMLLEAAGSSIDVESAVQLPPAINMGDLAKGGSGAGQVDVSSFSALASDALTTGTFASTYAVTGANATASEAAATLYQENSTSVTMNSTDLGFDPTAPINVTEPLNATTRAAGDPVSTVSVAVKMILPLANCQTLSGSSTKQAEFVYQFKRATAAAWNKANPTLPMKAGDVTASIASAADISCGTYRLRRSLLAGSTTTASGSMAVGGTADQAATGASAYSGVASSAYAAGMSGFGVTGASATITSSTYVVNNGQVSNVGLAVGLGVGLGMGVLCIIVVAAIFVMKRRQAQAVAPAATAAPPANA